jgi:Family of unknown function (DUF6084)
VGHQHRRGRVGVRVARLSFDCIGAHAEPYAAAPTLTFRLRVTETTGAAIHAIALRCQIRIEPARRRYSPAEAERLSDLFGDVSRWADTLKPVQFTMAATTVPGFSGSVEVDLPVPCTYDLEIAATRYFYALQDDAAPLLLLFSGTIFGKNDAGGLAVEQIPWSAECTYRLPVPVWRDMVDRYFPGSAWLRLDRDIVDALGRYKSREALPTWSAAIGALLAEQDDRAEEPA